MATDGPIEAGLNAALSMVPTTSTITVNKDNVLQAAKIIQGVLYDQGAEIKKTFQRLAIVAPGKDPVSVQSARAWNAKLLNDPDSYKNRVLEYLDNLETLVANLRTTAAQYGYSDQQIADAFPAGPSSA